jgi:hypothetical protein
MDASPKLRFRTPHSRTWLLEYLSDLQSTQIARHFAEGPQHNGVSKFTAGQIAVTAESHRPDMSFNSRQPFGSHDRSIRACAFHGFARLRPIEAYTCISCDKKVDAWGQFDAGHFIPAGGGGFGLVFDEMNVNGECPRCNAWDEMHLFGYERGLDARYGAGTADKLKARYDDYHFKGKITKEWSQIEYDTRIRSLLSEL